MNVSLKVLVWRFYVRNRGQEDELDVPVHSIKVDHESRQGISKLLHSMWSLNREGVDY